MNTEKSKKAFDNYTDFFILSNTIFKILKV